MEKVDTMNILKKFIIKIEKEAKIFGIIMKKMWNSYIWILKKIMNIKKSKHAVKWKNMFMEIKKYTLLKWREKEGIIFLHFNVHKNIF